MIFLSEFKQLKSPEAGRISFKHFTCGFNFADLLKNKKWSAASLGRPRDSRHIQEFPLTMVAASRFPEPHGSRD